jgi:hypothetical protein
MFITRAIERGIDVKVIAQWQGHRDGGKLILDTYSRVRQPHSERMAALMVDRERYTMNEGPACFNTKYFCEVDAADALELAKFTWYLALKRNKYRNYAYAARNEVINGRPVTIFMQRQVLGLIRRRGMDVDHVDGNALNNTRANLRIATRSLNSGNKKRQANKKILAIQGRLPRFRRHLARTD